MELYIIRHGETIWNKSRLLQGSTDIELNDDGRKLAKITSEKLSDTHFDKIYSSPLNRAYETAQIIKKDRNIPIIKDDRLKEIAFGTNEGKDSEKLQADENNPFYYFFSKPELYVAPEGGESLEHICERAKEFLETIIEPQAEELERVAIVAHGALNKALMCHIKKHGIDEYWSGGIQKNCGVIIVQIDRDGYKVLDESKVFYDDEK